MKDDIGSLIQMTSGEPTLGAGQHTVMPENNTPSSTDQIVKNTGVGTVQTAPAMAPAMSPAQQANANTLQSLAAGANSLKPTRETNNLPPMNAGPTAMTVTDSGTNNPPAAQSFPTGGKPQVQPVVTAQPQSSLPIQQQAPVNVQQAQTGFTEDGDAIFDGEWDGEEEVEAPVTSANTQPATAFISAFVQQPPPSVAQVADPVAQIVQAMAPTQQATAAIAGKTFAGDDELNHIQSLLVKIEELVTRTRFEVGIAVMGNPNHRDQNNYIHTCIYRVRWEAQKLMSLGPNELLAMEAALTAHQVWVQDQENYWYGRRKALETELERIIFIKRDSYSAPTKTESENRLIAAEPRIREFRNEFMIAQAMDALFEKQGERFAQLEDGIKRTITMCIDEYNRSKFQTGAR